MTTSVKVRTRGKHCTGSISVFNRIILTCTGCERKRGIVPHVLIVGGQGLIDYLRGNVTPCECNAPGWNVNAFYTAEAHP